MSNAVGYEVWGLENSISKILHAYLDLKKLYPSNFNFLHLLFLQISIVLIHTSHFFNWKFCTRSEIYRMHNLPYHLISNTVSFIQVQNWANLVFIIQLISKYYKRFNWKLNYSEWNYKLWLNSIPLMRSKLYYSVYEQALIDLWSLDHS